MNLPTRCTFLQQATEKAKENQKQQAKQPAIFLSIIVLSC
jgi:hypothetical protein